jgi:predicted RNA binding protein YcfA (HicA-like mRNA interferase family)
MAKLPSIRARDVVRVAEAVGFVFDRQRGGHAVY